MWYGTVARGPIHTLLFAPDSETLYTADGRNAVLAWDIATHNSTELFQYSAQSRGASLHLSPDNESLLLGEAMPGIGRYWCFSRKLNRLVYPGDTTLVPAGPFWFLSSGARWPSFTRENRVYFVDAADEGLTYFSWPPLNTGIDIELPAIVDRKPIQRMISDAHGTRLAIWLNAEVVLIWDRFGEQQYRLVPATNTATKYPVMAFSPDGELLALGTPNSITIVDATQGTVILTIPLSGPCTTVAFHPDNRFLAGAFQGRARVFTWRLYRDARGQMQFEENEYRWGINHIRSVAFSPDGLLCAAGGILKQFVVWDVS